MSDKFEKSLKNEFERKMRALKRKAEEFREKGDLKRADECELLARHLEEYMNFLKRHLKDS